MWLVKSGMLIAKNDSHEVVTNTSFTDFLSFLRESHKDEVVQTIYVGVEVLTLVTIKRIIFCNMIPYILAYQRNHS